MSSGRRRAVGADVLLHQADAVHRQVQAVAAGVFEVEEISFDVRHPQMLQAAVAADAVVDVHDEVVGLQLAEVLQELRDLDPARVPALARLAEDVGFGDHDQAFVGNAEAFAEMAERRGAA